MLLLYYYSYFQTRRVIEHNVLSIGVHARPGRETSQGNARSEGGAERARDGRVQAGGGGPGDQADQTAQTTHHAPAPSRGRLRVQTR